MASEYVKQSARMRQKTDDKQTTEKYVTVGRIACAEAIPPNNKRR